MKLDRATIEAALAALSGRLEAQGVMAEICIFEGAAMVLALDARKATRDVDAVFWPAEIVRSNAAKVADELSLPEDWLNDGVKGFVSAKQDYVEEGMSKDLPNLRALRPSANYLLAMKCLAARVEGDGARGDRDDVEFLVRHLHLTTPEEVLAVVTRYYPVERLSPKTRFFVEELMSTIRP